MMRLAPSGTCSAESPDCWTRGRYDRTSRRCTRSRMWPRPGRTSPGTCHGFMGCRPMGRDRQDAGHTARSCSVWPGVTKKSGVAPTNFISFAGHNLAVNWKTGFRPKVSSRRSSRAERIESEPSVASQLVDRNHRQGAKNMMTISVIVGSPRQGRFSEKLAQWILRQLHTREGIEAQLLDLRDFPMPFFDQSPAASNARPAALRTRRG